MTTEIWQRKKNQKEGGTETQQKGKKNRVAAELGKIRGKEREQKRGF